jgi:hypothetical protein
MGWRSTNSPAKRHTCRAWQTPAATDRAALRHWRVDGGALADLRHSDWHVRRASALALDRLLGKRAIPDLEPLLADRAFGVRADVQAWFDAQKLMDELRRSRLLRAPDTQLLLTRTEDSLRRARRQVLGAYHANDVSAVLEDSGPLIVISVKAPVSSVGENAVNRYEEGIGEATNLHTRFPMLVFGFLMILPEGPDSLQSLGNATRSASCRPFG